MSRRLAVAAVLAGGLLAGCGAEGASVGTLPQGQFVRASADLQPRTHLFGDEVSAQVGTAVSTGIDFGITKNFAIVGGLRWIDSSVDADEGDASVNVDPLFARLGVAVRF